MGGYLPPETPSKGQINDATKNPDQSKKTQKNADNEQDEFIVRNRHFFEVQSYYYCDLSNDANYCSKEKHRVDETLDVKKDEFKHRNFLDVEFEFIKGDVFSKQVQSLLNDWAEEHNEKQYLSVFLAMANQRQNFVLGMNMPDSVYDNEVPIFVRQDRSDNFVSNLFRQSQYVFFCCI